MLVPGIQRLSHPSPNNLSPTISGLNNNANTASATITSVAAAAGTMPSNVLPHIIIQSQPQQLLHSVAGRSNAISNTTSAVNQLPLIGNQSSCLSTSLPSLQQQLKQNIITVHAIAPNTMAITTHANAPGSGSLFTPSPSSAASLTMTSLPLANNSAYNHTMGRAGQHCLYTTSNTDFLQNNRNNNNVLGSTASMNHQSLTQVISSAAMANSSQSPVAAALTVMSSSAGTPVSIHSSQNAILEYLENTTKM